MPEIKLITEIKADIKLVFDLSRSIDLHKISTEHTNEEAIAGRTSGLIELGESVTWRARHLGITQKLTTKITALNSPFYFTDEMVNGAFKSFVHEHYFSQQGDKTIMTDVFIYESPLGILGKLADGLFLKKHMTNLLTIRNQIIKQFAESERWKEVLRRN